MKKILFTTAFLIASAAWAGETSKMVVQGYLKSGSTAVSGSFRMAFTVKKNGTSIYCYETAASAVTVASGVFNYTLKNSNSSSCGGSGLAAELAAVNFGSDDVTVDVVVDSENNGIGTGTDASFTNLDIVSSPFAMVANVAKTANGVVDGSISDSHINSSAGISVSKISGLGPLATASGVGSSEITDGSITNADISSSAAISTSKISGLGSLATLSAVSTTQITDGTITNADISATAAIATSKIAGLGSLATASAVGSSQITDGEIVDADVSASAAISGSKLQAASASNAGAVTAAAQTLAGVKTFNDGVKIGSSGTTLTSVLTGSLAAASYTSIRNTAAKTADVTVTGAAVGDVATCSPNVAPPANSFGWSAAIITANSVRVYITNTNTTAVNWNTVAWKCIVTKF